MAQGTQHSPYFVNRTVIGPDEGQEMIRESQTVPTLVFGSNATPENFFDWVTVVHPETETHGLTLSIPQRPCPMSVIELPQTVFAPQRASNRLSHCASPRQDCSPSARHSAPMHAIFPDEPDQGMPPPALVGFFQFSQAQCRCFTADLLACYLLIGFRAHDSPGLAEERQAARWWRTAGSVPDHRAT